MSEEQGFRGLVGIRVDEAGEGRARASLTADERHLNPHGSVHGGLIATLLDSSMGSAVRTTGSGSGRPPPSR